MIELYVIESAYSEYPLAEIRTDGKNIDWIVDNTEGRLQHLARGDFAVFKSYIDRSSHLSMKTPEEATVGILRYSLENGDIVEITTDGKTAMLNGKLMPEEEKHGLMAAVNSGKIKVKGKADVSRPMPIAKRPKKLEPEKPAGGLDPQRIAAVASYINKINESEPQGTASRDPQIDSIDFEGTNYPEMGRQLLYLLKYGDTDA